MKKVKTPLILQDEDLRDIAIYSSSSETNLFNTELAVQSPYVPAKINGKQYIIATWIAENKKAGKKLTDVDIDKIVTKYINPFKEENLLEDVIKVNVKSTESILEFCNKYGLIGERINKLPNEKSGVDNLSKRVLASAMESYRYFVEQTLVIQGLVILYHEIVLPFREKYGETTDKDGVNITNSEFELKLKQGINSGLALVRPALNLDYREGFLPSYTTSSLLGAIYYQLYETVTEGKQFRKCLHCGSLFIPRKTNAKFCPPTYAGKHSSCQNSYNQMKSRARSAVRSGRKTIEDISKSSGRPIEEVKDWFN